MTGRPIARAAALLGAALFVVAWVILPANPALACSCAMASVEEQAQRADAIFLGQVVDVRETAAVDGMIGSGDPVTYVVEVSRVYKGDVGATQEVVSARSGASCGLELPDSGIGPVLRHRRTRSTPGAALGEPLRRHGGRHGGSRPARRRPTTTGGSLRRRRR